MSATKVPTNNPNPSFGRALRLGGAGLLIATGSVHLDLYLTGYRHIPTIGPLFLLQVVSAYTLAVTILASTARLWSLAGGGFALSTLAGYLLSLWVGMLGFHETLTSAGVVAAILDIGAFVALFTYAGFVADRQLRDILGIKKLARVSLAPLGAAAVFALLVATFLTPGQASSSNGSSTTLGFVGHSVQISIMSFAFSPAKVLVAPGEKIIVTNNDSVTHTFTAKPQSQPLGAFNSGDIAPGRSVSVSAPMSPGTYAFNCSIHSSMTGTLVVK